VDNRGLLVRISPSDGARQVGILSYTKLSKKVFFKMLPEPVVPGALYYDGYISIGRSGALFPYWVFLPDWLAL
jgi:hypothetical protein